MKFTGSNQAELVNAFRRNGNSAAKHYHHRVEERDGVRCLVIRTIERDIVVPEGEELCLPRQ